MSESQRPGTRRPDADFLATRAGSFAVVAVLIALAVLLRFRSLGPPSLWLDDAWQALAIKADTFAATARTGVTAPGFAFLLRAWLALVGFSELKAQLLTFVPAVVTPSLVYLAAVRRRVHPIAGLVAGTLIAVSLTHATYSTHVKPFAIDAAVATVLVVLAFGVIDQPDNARRWAALTGVSILGSVVTAAVVPVGAAGIAAGVVASARRRRSALPAAAALGLFATFAAGWWWLVLRKAVTPALRSFWSDYYVSTGAGLGAAARDVWRLSVGVLDQFAYPSGIILGLVAAYGLFVAMRDSVERGLVLLLPFVAALFLAVVHAAPMGGGRTDMYLYPGLAVLVGLGAHDVLRRIRGVLLPGTAAALAALVATAPAAAAYPREDIRPIVRAVQTSTDVRDAVLVYHYAQFAFALYTDRPVTLVQSHDATMGFLVRVEHPNTYVLPYTPATPDRYDALLDRLSRRYPRIWLPATKRLPDFAAVARRLEANGFRAAVVARAGGATLTLFDRTRP